MILAVDIGNSNIHFGVFEKNILKDTFSISTIADRYTDEYVVTIKLLLNEYGYNANMLDGVIIGSVAPLVTSKLQKAIARLTNSPIMNVGPGVKTGFKIKLDDPTELGADLAANTAGAIEKVGYPAIIIDLGTATTVSAIDSEKAYVGCYIMPGVQMSLNALHQTGLLPSVMAEKAVPVVGKNSEDSMRSGVILGAVMASEGLAGTLINELNLSKDTPVILTGGYAKDVERYFNTKVTYIENLTLKGLNAIYTINKSKSR